MMWIADWMVDMFGETGALFVTALVTFAVVVWWRHQHRRDLNIPADKCMLSESP